MTKEMYEDLLERNRLQISELNTLTEEQDNHIVELEKENAELKTKLLQEREIYWCKGFDSSKDKLTKAKDLLLRFIELKNKPCAAGHSINMLLYENISVEAEKFLKENKE